MFIGAAGQTTTEPERAPLMEVNPLKKKKTQPNMKENIWNIK